MMKKRHSTMLRLSMAFVVFFCSEAFSQKEHVEALEVLPSQCMQIIEGFGASGAWWAQSVGQWPADRRDEILKLLFSREDGIGLTIYRYNIGAGSGRDIRDDWRRVETFEISQGKYDWTRDAASLDVLEDVCKLGVEKVILFANSPPVRMTKSGYAYAGNKTGLSNLQDDMYEQYVTYLADIAEYFITQKNVPVYSISPINEPQWKWDRNNQEGCHYKPEEAARLVKLMVKELNSRNLGIQLDVIESGSWRLQETLEENGRVLKLDYLNSLFRDDTIRNNVDAYSLHSYWSGPEDKRAFSDYFHKTYPGKKLHLSEWCQMKGGRDYGMESALELANEVIDDFTIGSVSSWQYWIAVSKYNFRDGLIYVDTKSPTFRPTKRLWAMGNFSKFIRPGFVQLKTSNNLKGVKLLAALSPDEEKLVVVVVNNRKEQAEVKITFQDNSTFEELVGYETSESYDLQIVQPRRGGDQYSFKAASITTLEFTTTRHKAAEDVSD